MMGIHVRRTSKSLNYVPGRECGTLASSVGPRRRTGVLNRVRLGYRVWMIRCLSHPMNGVTILQIVWKDVTWRTSKLLHVSDGRICRLDLLPRSPRHSRKISFTQKEQVYIYDISPRMANWFRRTTINLTIAVPTLKEVRAINLL